ncbi:MAG: hypothetical protein IPP71_16500 [Bacteroidetes bacterium]|nr:hypothetical protein [Bacteroidota bacterium]
MKTKITSKFLSLLFLAGASVFTACKDDDPDPIPPVVNVLPKLTLELDHLAGASKFYLDSTYTNENGDQFTATLFKYYISNIRLVKTDNSIVTLPNTYFLVNQDDEESMAIKMDSLPLGLFKSIKFMIGVDSTRNVSGAQTGALDPTNGMFWSWTTGYIFLKLEGTSPVIPTVSNEFTFHIGGFKGANINYKELEIPFNGDILTLNYNKQPELHFVVDVLEIFKNPTTINLATFPSTVMSPNASASSLATNYADMFTYDHMHDE